MMEKFFAAIASIIVALCVWWLIMMGIIVPVGATYLMYRALVS